VTHPSLPEKLREIRGHSFWDDFGEGIVVIDLGANVGRFASEFLALHPTASLVLVEGDPYLNGILQRTFARSSRVQLFQGLVGAECAPNARFYLCQVPEGNSVFRRFATAWAAGETREIEVEVISLGALLELAGCESVDLLKVDIEGSEWDVLGTLGASEARRIGQISVEFHDFLDPALRHRTEQCIHRLEELGYTALCRPTDRVHGSPYFDCLFYRR
jgi:FkbM family methyltransferase